MQKSVGGGLLNDCLQLVTLGQALADGYFNSGLSPAYDSFAHIQKKTFTGILQDGAGIIRPPSVAEGDFLPGPKAQGLGPMTSGLS